jgi:hypothetical protein
MTTIRGALIRRKGAESGGQRQIRDENLTGSLANLTGSPTNLTEDGHTHQLTPALVTVLERTAQRYSARSDCPKSPWEKSDSSLRSHVAGSHSGMFRAATSPDSLTWRTPWLGVTTCSCQPPFSSDLLLPTVDLLLGGGRTRRGVTREEYPESSCHSYDYEANLTYESDSRTEVKVAENLR